MTGYLAGRVIASTARRILKINPSTSYVSRSLSFQLVAASCGYLVGELFVINIIIPRLLAPQNEVVENERSRRAL